MSQTKSIGVGLVSTAGALNKLIRYVGALSFAYLSVCSAYGAPVVDALPQGGVVAQGGASIHSSANVMNIIQSSDKAVVNWQSFDIGSAASVNVLQPSATSVLLNRVVGDNPSQIFGTLNANGQVVLVNPKGIVFGSDGSVNAAAFTASTLGISDADFMAGNYRFIGGNGAGAIVNQGTISTRGYVALLGASVTNDGKIISNQGDVFLGAAQAISVPVSNSGRIKMELDPASVNVAINNTANGVIVTSGGQVFIQAAAINDALVTANITQSGLIDTSAAQAGSVQLLADSGNIKVSGLIEANSSAADTSGGRIIVGRDEVTGVLANNVDVSGASFRTNGGFVETSGHYLKADDVSVIAKDWLLDPADITLSDAGTDANYTNTSGSFTPNTGVASSTIKNSTIAAQLERGTNVTITTTNNGTSGSGIGNISMTGTISKAASRDANGNVLANGATNNATLSLIADNGITIAGTIKSTSGGLDVNLTANGKSYGKDVANMTTAERNASKGVVFSNPGAFQFGSIDIAGNLVVTGTSYAAGGSGVHVLSSTGLTAKNITINGTSETASGATGYGVKVEKYYDSGASVYKATAGNISITGTTKGAGTGSGVYFGNSGAANAIPSFTATGDVTLKGVNQNASNTFSAIDNGYGMLVKAVGNISILAETANANTTAINLYSFGGSQPAAGITLQSVDSNNIASGNILIQSNQGGINLNQNNINTAVLALRETKVVAKNITIDNTGGTVDANTGSILKGAGFAANLKGVALIDGRTLTAVGNFNIYGATNSAAYVGVDDNSIISATGLIQIASSSNINIQSSLTTTSTTGNAITLNAGEPASAGTSSGGNIILSGTALISTGSGGSAKLYTGSIAGSTGLTSLVGLGSGKFRYNSDETTTNYTLSIGAGIYAIYREAPALGLQANLIKIYDGQYVTSNVLLGTAGAITQATGILQNGDTFDAAKSNALFSFGGASQQKDYAFGGYAITSSNAPSALGYLLSTSGSLTINKASAMVTANSGTTTYNGQVQSVSGFTVTGLVNGEQASVLTSVTAGGSGTNAGTYTATAVGSDNNYNLTFVEGAFVIAKANATVTANSGNTTYNGQIQSVSGFTVTGLVNGEQASVLSGVGAGGSGTNAGSYTTTATGVDGNYNLSFVDGTLTINKATLTASLVGTVTKEYDGTFAANNLTNSNFSVTGWVTGESATVNQTLATYSSKNVDSNTSSNKGVVTANLSSANFTPNSITDLNNYNLPTTAAGNVGVITPASLTIKVNDTGMFVTQDPNQAASNGLSYTGFKNADGVSDLANIGMRTYLGVNNPSAGSYTNVYGLSTTPAANNGNYTITVVNGNLTVTPAAKLQITIGNENVGYGTLTALNAPASATNVTAVYCLNGSISCGGSNIVNLTMTNLGSGQWKATDTTNTSVTFSMLLDTAGHISTGGYLNVGNYSYDASQTTPPSTQNFGGRDVVRGVLTVTPQTLTLNASNVTKVYDGTNAVAGMALTPTGVMGGDAISVSSAGGTFGGVNAGSQSFSLTGLSLQGNDRANYSFASNSLSGIGMITQKVLTVVGGSAEDKVFDGNTSVRFAPGQLNGLVTGETLSLTSSAVFSDANIGSNKDVLVTYNISNGSGLASNYKFANGNPSTQLNAVLHATIRENKPFVNPNNNTKPAQPTDAGSQTHVTSSGSDIVTVKAEPARPQNEVVASSLCVPTLLTGVDLCFLPYE